MNNDEKSLHLSQNYVLKHKAISILSNNMTNSI